MNVGVEINRIGSANPVPWATPKTSRQGSRDSRPPGHRIRLSLAACRQSLFSAFRTTPLTSVVPAPVPIHTAQSWTVRLLVTNSPLKPYRSPFLLPHYELLLRRQLLR